MSATLAITINGQSIEIPCSSVLTIGRDRNNDVVITDPVVSRSHAVIRQLGTEDFYLVDGGSSNGSVVNGIRITAPTLLNDGDQITIGSHLIQFHQSKKAAMDVQNKSDETLQISQFNIRQITVLVSDIRGYTTMAEETPIRTLTKIMSEWSRLITEQVGSCGGILEKFIGDCVYVRWEAGENALQSIVTGLRFALKLHEISSHINRQFPVLPMPFKTGIGINTGYAAVDVGKDSIALGDTVNLAFRLESATREFGSDVILSADSYHYLPSELWRERTNTIQVKGKKQPVTVCNLSFSDVLGFLSGRPS